MFTVYDSDTSLAVWEYIDTVTQVYFTMRLLTLRYVFPLDDHFMRSLQLWVQYHARNDRLVALTSPTQCVECLTSCFFLCHFLIPAYPRASELAID